MRTTELACPFCGETDFDLTGLKSHLTKYCDIFRDTEDAEVVVARQIVEGRRQKQHVHKANGVNDACAYCGLDLRDEVHIRATVLTPVP